MQKGAVLNPFSITSYLGPDYFCDRETEVTNLRDAIYNGRNVTLISPRRIGKTGLIRHLFNSIPDSEANCFYIDLFGTSNVNDFTKRFAESVFTKKLTPFSKRVLDNISAMFGALRPVLSFDAVTGAPQCSVSVQAATEEYTLQQLFALLENSDKPCYVAFDESQIVADYKECKMEEILRSHIQHLNNVHFIFAGSVRHVMMQMFTMANRPFFQSTQLMHIGVIDEQMYYEFAQRHLHKHSQELPADVFHALYQMVCGHTWYIQFILNRLYQNGKEHIDEKELQDTVNTILEEYTPSFQMYCRLVTVAQLKILKAIACEWNVKEITSGAFITKYMLGATSTIRGAIASLVEKEFVFEDDCGEYSVYDKFFNLWLRKYS